MEVSWANPKHRNVGLRIFYGGQFTLSTLWLIICFSVSLRSVCFKIPNQIKIFLFFYKLTLLEVTWESSQSHSPCKEFCQRSFIKIILVSITRAAIKYVRTLRQTSKIESWSNKPFSLSNIQFFLVFPQRLLIPMAHLFSLCGFTFYIKKISHKAGNNFIMATNDFCLIASVVCSDKREM